MSKVVITIEDTEAGIQVTHEFPTATSNTNAEILGFALQDYIHDFVTMSRAEQAQQQRLQENPR
jgi:hypothetical protein